jgi:hypothetical protein
MMRVRHVNRLAVVVGVAAATAASSTVAGAGETSSRASASSRCATQGTTIAANAGVRVYRIGPRDGYTAYACALRSGRRVALGPFDADQGGARAFRLAGRYVAYEEYTCDRRCGGRIVVFDALRRRVARAIPTPSFALAVTDLEVTPRGSVSWIRQIAATQTEREVRRADASGEAPLDRGPDIEPGSLARSSSRVYWTKAGQPASAEFR